MFEEVSANAAATALSRKQNVVIRDQKDQANARSAILRLYPWIPLQDVDIVLGHGFAKGTGRVGRTGTLSMDEKVSLAVTAHVRHTHTSYDSILSGQDHRKGATGGRRKEARAQVRHDQDAVLDSWRGLQARGHPKSIPVLGLAQPVKRVNPKASHRVINTSTPMVFTESKQRHRTVDFDQESLPISKRAKRQAAIEAEAIISHGQQCVSRESSVELSDEYVDVLSDDACNTNNHDEDEDNGNNSDDDLSQLSISVTTELPPFLISVKFKRTNLPLQTSWVKTRKTVEPSQRGVDRTKKRRRGFKQQKKTAECSSARAKGLDSVPDVVLIEESQGNKCCHMRG